MFRITRFRLAVVLLVVVGAFFIDGYSLIYRYLVVHQPLGTTLTSTPTFLGRQLFIHKGLDLQGGTELTIEICHGFDNPNAECRNGPPNGASLATAQQATIPILDQRVNQLGVSEASVQAPSKAAPAQPVSQQAASQSHATPAPADADVHRLRGAAARTKETLWTTIGQLLDRFKPAECRNYLANSGYEFT